MKMKKNKLANLLKLGILLFGISFFLFSCEKDELITIEVSSKIIPKKMSISEAKKDKDFILVSEKFKLNPYLNENNSAKKSNEFTIDFSSFYKIKKENYTSYTFLLKRNNKDNSITENLVVEKRNDTVRGYIVKYSNIFYRKNGNDLFLNAKTSRTYFKGNIEELLDQNNIKFHNKAGWSCSWNTTYTPRTCSVHGEFNEGNSDCGNYGKSNWTSSSYQTCSYNPTENTLSESSGHNLDFGSGGGGGGGSGSSETAPIIPCTNGDVGFQNKTTASDCIQILEEEDFQIFLDPSFENSFANCAYTLLTENNLIQNILKKLIPKNSKYNVTFKVGTSAGNGGDTSASYGINGDIIVTINKDLVDTGNVVSISETILHEAVHAKLFEMVKSIGGLDKLNEFTNEDSEIGKLAACYNKYGKPELQHEFIWENYVKEIAIGTETIHKLFPENYNRFHDYMDGTTGYTKDSFYESVAKAGLNKTSYFKNLDITKQNTLLLLYGSLKANGKRLTDYKNCN
jgi:hypothetical protein